MTFSGFELRMMVGGSTIEDDAKPRLQDGYWKAEIESKKATKVGYDHIGWVVAFAILYVVMGQNHMIGTRQGL